MTDQEPAQVYSEQFPATRFTAAAEWYVTNRLLPAVLYLMLGVAFFTVLPPWGELEYVEFFGWLCMLAGALGYEAVVYQPWRDA